MAFSQDQASSDDVLKTYVKELKLNSDLAQEFRDIFLDFAPQLKKENLSVADYNALMKQETLGIYKILSKEQFAIYKKLKKSIEPNKKYRVETN